MTFPILMYHSVCDEYKGFLTVPQHSFADQMKYLADEYTPLTIHQAIQVLRGHSVVQNPVLITFDDGYEDTYYNALPILQKLNIPAIFFLATDYIGQDNSWNPKAYTTMWHMSYSEISEMSQIEGLSFGAHCLTHHRLTEFGEERITAELIGSRKVVEDLTNQVVTTCAYPYGDFNDLVLQVASQHFDLGFAATKHTSSLNSDNLYSIWRFYIRPNATLTDFAELLRQPI